MIRRTTPVAFLSLAKKLLFRAGWPTPAVSWAGLAQISPAGKQSGCPMSAPADVG